MQKNRLNKPFYRSDVRYSNDIILKTFNFECDVIGFINMEQMKKLTLLLIIFTLNISKLICSDFDIKAGSSISAGIAAPLLFLADEPVRDYFQANKGKWGDRIFLATNQLGEIYNNLGLAGVLYIGGAAARDDKIRKTGLYLIESTLVTTLSISAVKSIFGRSRPYLNEGNMKFNFFQFDDSHLSFPSGHSGLAFSMATIISHQINKTPAYIISYTLAGMTMMSRIYYDKHWLSDTFLGAVMGTASGLLVLYLNEEDELHSIKKQAEPVSLPIVNFSIKF